MKKTIFLACLLSGMTMATESTPPTFIQDGEPVGDTIEAVKDGGAYALIFDWEGIHQVDTNYNVNLVIYPYYQYSPAPGEEPQELYVYFKHNGTHWTAKSYYGANGVGSSDYTSGTKISLPIEGTWTYIIQHDNTGFSLNLLEGNTITNLVTLQTDDYIEWTENSGIMLNWASGNITNIELWQGEIKNASDLEPAQGVPEPTTATLSLLALAGLAIRRRRR